MPDDEPQPQDTSPEEPEEPAQDEPEVQSETAPEPADASAEPRTREVGPDDPDDDPTPEDDFETLWSHLSDNQRKYVLARQSHSKKAYAAESVDLHRDTVYGWPEYVEACASKLVDKQKDEIAYALQELEYKGIRELERLLEQGQDERTKLEAIRTILNRNRGKPTKRTEVEHSGGIDIDADDEDAIDDALGHLD